MDRKSTRQIKTLDGSGHSSRKRVITAGPNGSSIGTVSIIHITTKIHPPSLSAIRFNFNNGVGGSWSLKNWYFYIIL